MGPGAGIWAVALALGFSLRAILPAWQRSESLPRASPADTPARCCDVAKAQCLATASVTPPMVQESTPLRPSSFFSFFFLFFSLGRPAMMLLLAETELFKMPRVTPASVPSPWVMLLNPLL